jgi:hypothetical protein
MFIVQATAYFAPASVTKKKGFKQCLQMSKEEEELVRELLWYVIKS